MVKQSDKNVALLVMGAIIGGHDDLRQAAEQIAGEETVHRVEVELMKGLDQTATKTLFEDDPLWNGPHIVPATMCFLSVGPGTREDMFYPVLMGPKDTPLIERTGIHGTSEDGEFVVLARMKMGFETPERALAFASRMMKSVAVYNKYNRTFEYPHFNRLAARAVLQAQERREKRRKKRADRNKSK